MFDPQTSALIADVPDLPGLEPDQLAKQLSEAFATISAARIRLRTLEDAEADEGLNEVINKMRRLALANEAFVTVDIDRADRAAAAFVAGTAYQLLFNAEQLQERPTETSHLTARGISPDISAVLLFLIAEATADAFEAAEFLSHSSDDPIEQAIIGAIRSLARGRLADILEADVPTLDYLWEMDLADVGIASLYRQILVGIHTLSARLVGRVSEDDPKALFLKTRELCLSEKYDVFDDGQPEHVAAFAGPFHLATLLAALSGDLLDSAVVNVPAPDGLDPKGWADSLKKIAMERPYLWRNHREAIDKGYLEIGTSSVVGFPTGAGKSTLSELKINATLRLGKTVVFLAPTLALVDQTATSLSKAFPNAQIGQEQSDPFLDDIDEDTAEIFVLTPEACLAQMSFDQQSFVDVGLVVFDECHLLHPSGRPEDRRPVDAMLCLLNLIRLAQETDVVLLSAMMKNTDELAGWLSDLTGNPCLSLALSWKPTRQIRGCVVYDGSEIGTLSTNLRKQRSVATTKGVPVAAKRSVGATPLGFFSLHQTWATKQAKDYSLQKLLDDRVLLGINPYWGLTPNAGELSSAIGAKSSQMGVKTLIFFQTIKNANSAAKKITELLGGNSIELTATEKTLHAAASLEFGSKDCLYLNVEDNHVAAHASIHHGMLFPEERRLVESLYKRPGGLSVLCATSTLAQGMNLPSEMVIIAEDSRFNEAANKREILEAQDLLNAAGRAGRAGMIANGMVLVVPGKVVAIDMEKLTIGSHWTTLLSIFGQSDQCLVIDDPLTSVMDRIHAGADPNDEIAKYSIARLTSVLDGEDAPDLSNILTRTLSGYRARKAGETSWLEDRVASIMKFAEEAGLLATSEIEPIQNVAALFGFPLSVVESLRDHLGDYEDVKDLSVLDWCETMFDWLNSDIDAFQTCIRHDNLTRLFGKAYEQMAPEDRVKHAIPKLRALNQLWMTGEPLIALEEEFQQKKIPEGNKCVAARRFALRCVPDLSYAFSLPAKLLEHQLLGATVLIALPGVIENLARCVREGFCQTELLALQHCLTNKALTRRQIYQQFEDIVEELELSEPDALYETILDRVETAVLLS